MLNDHSLGAHLTNVSNLEQRVEFLQSATQVYKTSRIHADTPTTYNSQTHLETLISISVCKFPDSKIKECPTDFISHFRQAQTISSLQNQVFPTDSIMVESHPLLSEIHNIDVTSCNRTWKHQLNHPKLFQITHSPCPKTFKNTSPISDIDPDIYTTVPSPSRSRSVTWSKMLDSPPVSGWSNPTTLA